MTEPTPESKGPSQPDETPATSGADTPPSTDAVPPAAPAQEPAPDGMPPQPPPATAPPVVSLGSLDPGPSLAPESRRARMFRGARNFRWTKKKTIAAVAVGLALAAGVGGVFYATGSDSHSNSPAAIDCSGGRIVFPGDQGVYSYSPLQNDSLHSEFVVFDAGSGYLTKYTQLGVVTEITSDSVTVRSADGYTKTYAMDADTVRGAEEGQVPEGNQGSGIQNGDVVSVMGTVSGDKLMADVVTERNIDVNGLPSPRRWGVMHQAPVPPREGPR